MSDIQTFSRRPWINLDMIDENGVRAEVQVNSGVGTIEKIEKTDRAAKVSFSCNNLKFPVSGGLPCSSPLLAVIEKAAAEGQPVEYRIEKVRKGNIDRTIPFNELFEKGNALAAKDSIFKNLVAVRTFNENGEPNAWVFSSAIKTRMEEDPVDGAHVSAYDVPMEVFTGKKNAGSHNPPRSNNRRNSIEPPSYIDRCDDGSVNPGSRLVAAYTNTLAYVQEYNRTHDNFIEDGQCRSLAKILVAMINKLQVKIYGGKLKKADMSLESYTRARAIVYETIRQSYVITPDIVSDLAKTKEWGNRVIEESLDVWRWAIESADKH